MRLHPAVARTRREVRDTLRIAVDAGQVSSGGLVLAGVSGGPDSLALAAALSRVADRLGLRAGAVVVDHQLQPGSASVAATVGERCRDLGLDPVVVRAVQVGRSGGPEGAARTARLSALRAAAGELDADAVLLGHTLDDQAETVLLGLGRGSGARSLSGMAPVTTWRGLVLLRPLLRVRRSETAAACEALGLPVWHDPMNADDGYARVRVRHNALPALERALGPGVAEALARTAALLRDDADALDGWADTAATELSPDRLAELPAAVRRRVLRSAAVAAGAPPGQLSARHVDALDGLVV
ncbi:MAG: tRNA lysidine(34) synthetase TilS, partial [Frankiales bacterium]|nr:tRNA lysidine(34) synthetase TilS [Frankiales bacterium]